MPGNKHIKFVLVIFLAFSLQACLLEVALAQASQLLGHGSQEHVAHENAHGKKAPSHQHDKKGEEGKVCCDNEIALLSLAPNQPVVTTNVLAYLPAPGIDESSTEFSSIDFLSLHAFLQTGITGARDTYALSCLLHAPPHNLLYPDSYEL